MCKASRTREVRSDKDTHTHTLHFVVCGSGSWNHREHCYISSREERWSGKDPQKETEQQRRVCSGNFSLSQSDTHPDFLSFSVTLGLWEPHKLSVYKKCWRFWLSSFIMKVQANRQKRSFYSSWPEGDYGSGNCSALLLWHWNVNRILGNVTSYKRPGYKIPLGRLWVRLSFCLFIFSVAWKYSASNQSEADKECREEKRRKKKNRPINKQTYKCFS